MTIDWRGVFPAITTKFDEHHQLDLDAVRNHLRFQLQSGVHGVIALGTLGENAVLSTTEKKAVVEAVVTQVNGRVPVLATVAETTTHAAVNIAQSMADIGADGLMLLPGMLYTADRRETLAHYRAVATATNLPIMIYNNPVSYKVDITPDMLVELADEPKFVAVKESSDDVRRLTDIINLTGNRFALFSGVDDLAMESLLLGAVGWVAGLVNAFPAETVAIYDLIQAGDLDRARQIYRWFMPMLHLDVSTKLVQNIKLAEAVVGCGTEHVRAPRLPLAGAEREHVLEIIHQAVANRPQLTTAVR